MSSFAVGCAILLGLQQLGGHTFHRQTLENGLEAVAVDDGQPGTISVFVVYAVGNRAEKADTSGIAHLTEHALYTGTATTAAGKHDAAIVKLGGESNAYTRDDTTVYYDHKVPPEALEQVLALEADRMRGLTWDEKAFLHERDRLQQEERRNNDPQVQLAARREHEVWGGVGYGAGLLDANGNTRGPGLSRAEVRAFYDAWYHPRNAAVVVIGGDPEKALAAIAKAFGPIAKGPERPALPTEAAGQLPREVQNEAPLSRDRLEWAWVGPARTDPDRLALRVLALLFERRTAPDGSPVDVGMGDRAGPDLFLLAATGPDAAKVVASTFEELRASSFDAAKIADAKRRLKDELATKPLRSRPYFSLAVDVAAHAALGEVEHLFLLEKKIDAVDGAALVKAAARWLAPEKRIALAWKATAVASGGAPLPEDKAGLRTAAEAAEASGDPERAILAYEKLLALGAGRIDTVIYRYQLGALNRQQGRLEKAKQHLEAGLAVVDYPALRELLNEVEREMKEGPKPDAKPAPTPTPSPPPAAAPSGRKSVTVKGGELPPAWAAEAEKVLRELEQWRGLVFLQDVVVEVLPEDPEGPAGWYEPKTKRLVVTRKGSERFGRGVMLHELFHALQDQHFDLAKLHAEATTTDRARALSALVEGEAMLAVSELMSYDFKAHAKLGDGPLDEARYQKLFQYGAGLDFVTAIRDARGWAGVAEAFARPPRTTAEVFHPTRWLRGEAPREADQGEYGLRLFLARDPAARPQLEPLGAALVKDVLREETKDGQVAHEWELAFVSPEEAAAFAMAARAPLKLVPKLIEGSGKLAVEEERVRLSWRSAE